VAVTGYNGFAGSDRGLSSTSLRGHEFMRHSCQTGDDYAKGYSTGEADSWCLGRWIDGLVRVYFGNLYHVWTTRVFFCLGVDTPGFIGGVQKGYVPGFLVWAFWYFL